jgi:hypothetical protein
VTAEEAAAWLLCEGHDLPAELQPLAEKVLA